MQVWHLNRRIKLHLTLTAIAILVDIGITIAGVSVVLFEAEYDYMFATWNMRYVHIALDTAVLYTSLATPSFNIESEYACMRTVSIDEEAAAHPRHVTGVSSESSRPKRQTRTWRAPESSAPVTQGSRVIQ